MSMIVMTFAAQHHSNFSGRVGVFDIALSRNGSLALDGVTPV
jgi:hypothetical protein